MMKRKLFLLLTLLVVGLQGLLAQERIVQGVVRSKTDNQPLVGVSVVVLGTQTGVTTDIDGRYKIGVPENAVLRFTYVGYDPQQIDVGTRTHIDVEMSEDNAMLDDIVIVGYGTMKKSDLTGSVASVKAAEVVNTSAGSVEKLLQGRVSGLQVINSNDDNPQGGVVMRVRGMSSLNGSNSPLLVLDGIPMGDAGNITTINPNVIESIEVLKDASATAIYGSRGANGVIMVTTKNGVQGLERNNIWFTAKTGVKMFSKELDYWRDVLTMAELENESYENGGAEGPYTGKRWLDGTYYPSIAEIRNGEWPYRTDWSEQVFRTAMTHDYNLGVDGATDKSRYFASVGYYNAEGMQHNDDYEKLSIDFSFDHRIARKVWLRTKSGFIHSNRSYNLGTSYGRNPLFPVYNGDGSYFQANPTDWGNVAMINNELSSDAQGMSAFVLAKFEWELLPGLLLAVSGNARGAQNRTSAYYPKDYSSAGHEFGGQANNGESSSLSVLGDAYLTYNKEFGRNHRLSAMVGLSYEDTSTRSSAITGRGLANDILRDEVIGASEKLLVDTDRVRTSLAAYFTRLNYTLKDRYLFTFTARADGSSKFRKGHKWGFFPSGAVSWKLEEEEFIKRLDFFDQLKIRASYGISGNQGISPYQTFERYGSDYFWLDGKEWTVHGVGMEVGRDGAGNRYAVYGGMPNADLTWEKTRQFDIGLDLSIFKGRLNVTLDYYKKITTDLLRQQYMAPSTGYDLVWVNSGKIRNTGFEASVNGRIVSRPAFNLNATWIFNLNRNKVLDIGTKENAAGYTVSGDGICFTPSSTGTSAYHSAYLNVYAVGYPLNSFFGYRVHGIIQTPKGTAKMCRPGEFNYEGLNEDGTLDPDARTIIGDPNPKFTTSLNLSMSHRIGLDLSVMLYCVYGNDIFSTRKLTSPRLLAGRWTPEHPNNERPRLRYDREIYASDWFVEDGSFLRIQNITLGYTLPSHKARFPEHLRVYVSVANPVTFSKVSEYDPEVGETGYGTVAYPRICTITGGLEFKF